MSVCSVRPQLHGLVGVLKPWRRVMAEPQGLSVCDVEPLAPVLQAATTSWPDGDVGSSVVDAQASWCDDLVCLQQVANRLMRRPSGGNRRHLNASCSQPAWPARCRRRAGHTARQSHELVRRQVSHRPEREVNGVWGLQDGIHDQHGVILASGGPARLAFSLGARHARRTRFRSRSKPARPNIWRLSILKVTWNLSGVIMSPRCNHGLGRWLERHNGADGEVAGTW